MGHCEQLIQLQAVQCVLTESKCFPLKDDMVKSSVKERALSDWLAGIFDIFGQLFWVELISKVVIDVVS